MKFSLKATCKSGRIGVITNITRLPNFEMETPHALLYTKGGSIPYITHEILQMMTNEKLGILIPLPNILNMQDRMKLYKHSISEFVGLNECLSYCSFINPGEKRTPGFHEKMGISLWTRFGRKIFTVESYMEFMENLKPDLFVTLADGDTDNKSSQKRMTKAVECTLGLFEKCVELCKESNILETNQMIGVIEGGFNESLREECSKVVGESPVVGVVIDGLHDCSKTVSEMKADDIIPVLKASLKHIPNDKLRILHGCWNPSMLLDLIEFGIDLFDSSYPFVITEESAALVFPVSEDIFNNSGRTEFKNNNSLKENGSGLVLEVEEPTAKKIKLTADSKYYISLKDPKYVTDFSPIMENCTCLTCQNHTRSYIHHLVNVQELLGSTLLMIHNIHHYLQFLSTARKALKTGTFQEMKREFQLWADSLDNTSIS